MKEFQPGKFGEERLRTFKSLVDFFEQMGEEWYCGTHFPCLHTYIQLHGNTRGSLRIATILKYKYLMFNCAFYTNNCTFYTNNCTFYTNNCTFYLNNCTFYSNNCTFHTNNCTFHTNNCTFLRTIVPFLRTIVPFIRAINDPIFTLIYTTFFFFFQL